MMMNKEQTILNIENVIKALECCRFERQCDTCPYNSHGADDCDNWLLFDAERLLKQYQLLDILMLNKQ